MKLFYKITLVIFLSLILFFPYFVSAQTNNGCCQVICEPGAPCAGGCYSLPCPFSSGNGLTVSVVENGTCQAGMCTTADYSTKEEVSKPFNFVPQVTIPGSINIGGKEITFRQGAGIEITGSTAAQYFAVFYRFFVAALVIIAVVMVMWGGFKRIMAAGSQEKIKSANDTITGAITGVVLALVSYSLLALINPALVSFKPLDIEPIKKVSLKFISTSDYEKITGKFPPKAFSPEVFASMKAAAQAGGINYCVLYTILNAESGGRADAIGYDENVNNALAEKVPSRKRFVQVDECKQYISKSNASDCELRGSAKNDDAEGNIKDNQNDLGLDWRYSRGFGLGQITIFPSWHSLYRSCSGTPCINIGGKDYLPKDLFDIDTNLEAVVNLWKYEKCPGEVTQDCFTRYNGATEYGVEAMTRYNACIKQNQ